MKILLLMLSILVIKVFAADCGGEKRKKLGNGVIMICKKGVWRVSRRSRPKGPPCMDDLSFSANGICSADRGHCNQYTDAGQNMTRDCPGTCESCDACRCQDTSQWQQYCPFWTQYCSSSGVLGTWMTSNCRKTCGKCDCKCCSYGGKQHQLGSLIRLPEKCGELICEEGLVSNYSPFLSGAAGHKVSHPEELTLNFRSVHDGVDCCILPGNARNADGSSFPNGTMVKEGWKGILDHPRANVLVSCCHGVLCTPLNGTNQTSPTTTMTPTTTTSTTTTTTTLSTSTTTTSTTTTSTTTTSTTTTSTTTTTTSTTTTTTTLSTSKTTTSTTTNTTSTTTTTTTLSTSTTTTSTTTTTTATTTTTTTTSTTTTTNTTSTTTTTTTTSTSTTTTTTPTTTTSTSTIDYFPETDLRQTPSSVQQDTTHGQLTSTGDSTLSPSIPTSWLNPVTLAAGYNELQIKLGLDPHRLKVGMTPKQIETLQHGLRPKQIDAKILLTGLQPTAIDPWQVLTCSSKTKTGDICIQTTTTSITTGGPLMIVKMLGKRPTVINVLRRKPMILNF